MTGILGKYILREAGLTWLVVTAVLLLILLAARFARYIGQAAAGELPPDVVLQLLGLSALHYLIILVPVALFLALLLALGRLCAESELTAMQAGGLGLRQLCVPVLAVAVPAALVVTLLALEISPWAARQADEVQARGEQSAMFGLVQPGEFRGFDGGRAVFYARGADDPFLLDVFVRVLGEDDQEIVIAAQRGELISEGPSSRLLLLHDGYRYHGRPGSAEYQRIRFARHGLRYELPGTGGGDGRSTLTTAELLRSQRPADSAELHWRLAMPVSVVLLALLAVPLARGAPRQGRSWAILLGILVYLVYSNLLGTGQAWMAAGRLPGWVGLWWVHGLLLALIVGLLARQYGAGWVLGYARQPERG